MFSTLEQTCRKFLEMKPNLINFGCDLESRLKKILVTLIKCTYCNEMLLPNYRDFDRINFSFHKFQIGLIIQLFYKLKNNHGIQCFQRMA